MHVQMTARRMRPIITTIHAPKFFQDSNVAPCSEMPSPCFSTCPGYVDEDLKDNASIFLLFVDDAHSSLQNKELAKSGAKRRLEHNILCGAGLSQTASPKWTPHAMSAHAHT